LIFGHFFLRCRGADHLVTEGAIIGFWDNYREMVGFDLEPA